MSASALFETYLLQCPVIAILRGIRADEAEAIGDALVEGGIRIIEVPLNSPNPLDSIARLRRRLDGTALIGAGTVLQAAEVEHVRAAGGQLVVSPSINPAVIAATVASGMISCPGFFTPSEAFAAIEAGAHALKLFPAEGVAPPYVRSLRAVLPDDLRLMVFGGVRVDTIGAWLDAGADGFGIGAGIYRPGQSAADTVSKARSYREGLARR